MAYATLTCELSFVAVLVTKNALDILQNGIRANSPVEFKTEHTLPPLGDQPELIQPRAKLLEFSGMDSAAGQDGLLC